MRVFELVSITIIDDIFEHRASKIFLRLYDLSKIFLTHCLTGVEAKNFYTLISSVHCHNLSGGSHWPHDILFTAKFHW